MRRPAGATQQSFLSCRLDPGILLPVLARHAAERHAPISEWNIGATAPVVRRESKSHYRTVCASSPVSQPSALRNAQTSLILCLPQKHGPNQRKTYGLHDILLIMLQLGLRAIMLQLLSEHFIFMLKVECITL